LLAKFKEILLLILNPKNSPPILELKQLKTLKQYDRDKYLLEKSCLEEAKLHLAFYMQNIL